MNDISRRSFLGVSGAAALGTAGLSSVSLPDPRLPIGSNHNCFPDVIRRVPGACAVRIYYGKYGTVPSVWPDRLPGPHSLLGGPVIPPRTQTVLSIRPYPDKLLAGQYDSQIRDMVRSAPPRSRLSTWHEAGPGNPMGYPSFINAGSMHRVHAHMQALCRGSNVRYGSIVCGPANQLTEWLGNRLDWYGLDWFLFGRYRNPDGSMQTAKFESRMRHNLETWREVAGQDNPSIVICETNSPFDSSRSTVFTSMAGWLAKHGGPEPAMLTYWNPKHDAAHGGLSGPWPPSPAVVRQLRYLVGKYTVRSSW
jgi:hypothetical protein